VTESRTETLRAVDGGQFSGAGYRLPAASRLREGVEDAMAALGRLRSLPEVAAARVGVLGRPEAEFHEHPGAGHAFDKLPV
jgi:hypothetical protein